MVWTSMTLESQTPPLGLTAIPAVSWPPKLSFIMVEFATTKPFAMVTAISCTSLKVPLRTSNTWIAALVPVSEARL